MQIIISLDAFDTLSIRVGVNTGKSIILLLLVHITPSLLPILNHNLIVIVIYYREKGGAYGGGAKHGNGIFSFFSYR